MSRGKIENQQYRREISKASVVRISLLSALGVGVLALSTMAVNFGSQLDIDAQPGSIPTVTSTAAPGTVPRPITAAFLGDSYTHGTGASSPGSRWSSLVADAEGWTEVNAGLGGTGYATASSVNGCGLHYCPPYPERVAAIVAVAPSTVMVSGGQNDAGALAANPAAVRAAVDETFRTLRAGLPGSVIIAVGPSAPGATSQGLIELDSWVQSAAATVDATYVSLIDPVVIQAGMVTVDGGHVDDSGHRAIADRVLAAIAH